MILDYQRLQKSTNQEICCITSFNNFLFRANEHLIHRVPDESHSYQFLNVV